MDWEERLIRERNELEDRLDRLCTFMVGFTYPKLDQRTKSLLRIQRGLMEDYLEVLEMRLEHPKREAKDRCLPQTFSSSGS